MYTVLLTSASLRSESLRLFIESGRDQTIKKSILLYLIANPGRAYTAAQLQEILSISHRSSLCKPLVDLVELGFIEVIGSVYDSKTNREVGAYSIAKPYADVQG